MSDKDAEEEKPGSRGLRVIIFLTFLFGAWLIISSKSLNFNGNGPVTGLNVQFILNGFGSFVGNLVNTFGQSLGNEISGISQNPDNIVYLAAPIAVMGLIPLYSLTKRFTESGGLAFFVSVLYLFFCLLVRPSWTGFVYLSFFPTLILWASAAYARGYKNLSFFLFLGTIFVNPISAALVLTFALCAFYKSWQDGTESFIGNPRSLILESVSVFVFVIFILKYTYKFFLYPSLVYNINQTSLSSYGSTFSTLLMSNLFSNILPLIPEFTNESGILLSIVVLAVVGVMGGLSRTALKRVKSAGS